MTLHAHTHRYYHASLVAIMRGYEFTPPPTPSPGFDEGIRVEFLGDKSSWEQLDKAGWEKVGDGNGAWYFEAVEEFFGHLHGAMTGTSAT